jgi:hypothetical protein
LKEKQKREKEAQQAQVMKQRKEEKRGMATTNKAKKKTEEIPLVLRVSKDQG